MCPKGEKVLDTMKSVSYIGGVLNDTTKTEGMKVDAIRLEYEMKRRNVSKADICRALGISRSAFYRKTHGISEFTQREIQCIIDTLHLDSPMGIFFTSEVS